MTGIEQVRSTLGEVMDPELNRSIVALGYELRGLPGVANSVGLKTATVGTDVCRGGMMRLLQGCARGREV